MYIKYVTTILALTVGAGFYFTISEVVALKEEIQVLEDALQLKEDGIQVPSVVSEGRKQLIVPQPETTSTPSVKNGGASLNIPTAIIFNVLSDAALQPQSNVSVIIESVQKKGTDFILNVKTLTNEAQAYSTLNFKDIFQLVSFDKENEKPYRISGGFGSMPPKSTISGSVFIKADEKKNTLILQIETTGGALKHYEFNFDKKTYRETEIG